MNFRTLLLVFTALYLTSCVSDDNVGDSYGIFTVEADGLSASVEGEIKDRSLQDFQDMMSDYPDIEILNLVEVPGSNVSGDDLTDNALELCRAVYDNNIATHLIDDGMVASGGTDLLASGRQITVGANPEIGVHAWAGGWDGSPNGTAWDIKDDEEHPEHQKYLSFYEDVGFSAEEAKDFYFFTIRAAEANDIYNMTSDEIAKYFNK